jgi:hypothetical protein
MLEHGGYKKFFFTYTFSKKCMLNIWFMHILILLKINVENLDIEDQHEKKDLLYNYIITSVT